MTTAADGRADTGGLGGQIRSAVRWSALNSLIQRVGQVGVGILLARIVAPEQFGVFAVALVVLNIVLSVAEIGVSVALVRHEGDVREIAPTVTTLSIASGAVLAALTVAIAPWFASAMNAPQAVGVIQLMAVALLIAGVSAVPGAMLQREFRQDHKMAADTAAFVIGTAVAVVLAVAGFGAWSLAWSRVATNAAAAVVMFVVTKQRFLPGFDVQTARSVLKFGLPLAGSSLLIFAVLNVDYIVVGSMLGPVELAFYLLAFNLSSWPVGAFSQPVRSVSLAAFARVREDPVRSQQSFSRALALLALFTVPICTLLAAFDGPLVRFVYGAAWAPAAAALGLLALLGAIRVALELAYDFLASAGRSRAILAIHAVWLAALVPALVLGGKAGGIAGVAAAQSFVGLCVIVPAYLIALRTHGIRSGALARPLVRPLAGGVAIVVTAVFVRVIIPSDVAQLLVGGSLAVLLYAVVVFPLRHEVLALLRRRSSGVTASEEETA